MTEITLTLTQSFTSEVELSLTLEWIISFIPEHTYIHTYVYICLYILLVNVAKRRSLKNHHGWQSGVFTFYFVLMLWLFVIYLMVCVFPLHSATPLLLLSLLSFCRLFFLLFGVLVCGVCLCGDSFHQSFQQ